MREWVAFWNSPHSIYVNARHRDVHYRTVAGDIRDYVPGPGAVVLDYGCGEALHAGAVAATCRRLILCDAAPAVRESLARRFSDAARITVQAPGEVAAQPDRSVDLIVLNSVVQYLTPAEFDRLLRLAARLLRPGGRLVVGDVVPPGTSPLGDAWALLRFAARNGFLLAAVGGLFRTVLSPYRRLRARLGLRAYDAAAMRQRLAAAGFHSERAPRNIGHHPLRMTFVATPAVAEASVLVRVPGAEQAGTPAHALVPALENDPQFSE